MSTAKNQTGKTFIFKTTCSLVQAERKLGILIWIRDQRTKKQGNKGTAENWWNKTM